MGTSNSRPVNQRPRPRNRSSSLESRASRLRDNAACDQQAVRLIETSATISNHSSFSFLEFHVLPHIGKNSINCLYSKKHSGRMYLQFYYDAKVPCLATLSFCVSNC